MFAFNQNNYFSKSKIRDQLLLSPNDDLDDIHHFSTQISPFVEVASLFAIIEHLIYTRDTQLLHYIVDACVHHANQLRQNLQDSTVCQKSHKIINQLVRKVQKQTYQQNIGLLKQLYDGKQDIMKYLTWVADKMGQDCMKMLSQKFDLKILVYEVSVIDGKKYLLMLHEFNQSENQNSMRQIRVGHFENKFHILYNVSHRFLDAVSGIIYQFQKVDSKYQKEIQQKDQEIKKLKIKIDQIQTEKATLNIQYDGLLYNYEQSTKNTEIKDIQIQKLNKQIQKLKQNKKEPKNKYFSQQKMKGEQKSPQNQHKMNKLKNKFKIVPEQKSRISSKKNSADLQHVHENPVLPAALPPKTPKKVNLNKFKIVQYHPTSQAQKKHLETIIKKAPTGQMTKLNAITFSLHINQTTCQTCQEIMIPYSIFDCNHLSCSNCLVRYIEVSLLEGVIPICISDGCGKQCNIHTAIMFLTFKERRDLCQKLEQTLYRIKYKNKLYTCPQCQNIFEINQQDKFVTHCNKIFCKACGEQHTAERKCDETRFINLLNQLEYPTVCPTCCTLFDKDDKCDHVVCPTCKDQNPSGFCARCAVIRSPTMAHDISYHRLDCSFYAPNPEPLKRQPKCLECQKIEGEEPCKRPTQTLKQFIENQFGERFTEKFFQKRKAYADLKNKDNK